MKLVEIVGKEMKVWPKEAAWIGQAHDGDIHVINNDNEFIRHTGKFLTLADDWHVAEINKAQWQAERDKQKGGEWKRHRGRKIPVSADSVVDVKLDTGEVMSGEIAGDWEWSHADASPRIMQYRIISQPQAEEVKLSKAEARRPFMGEPTWTVIDEAPDYSVGQWHQIDGPIKWRDTIVELEAHAEDIQRKIASLHARLTEEGFSLVRQYPSVQQPELAVDMSDWRNWKVGDIVTSVTNYGNQFSIGSEYEIESIENETLEMVADDVGDPNGWCVDNFKFIRRP